MVRGVSLLLRPVRGLAPQNCQKLAPADCHAWGLVSRTARAARVLSAVFVGKDGLRLPRPRPRFAACAGRSSEISLPKYRAEKTKGRVRTGGDSGSGRRSSLAPLLTCRRRRPRPKGLAGGPGGPFCSDRPRRRRGGGGDARPPQHRKAGASYIGRHKVVGVCERWWWGLL